MFSLISLIKIALVVGSLLAGLKFLEVIISFIVRPKAITLPDFTMPEIKVPDFKKSDEQHQ